MAALDGKITIEKELRPCIVHIPAITKSYRDAEGKRTVRTLFQEEKHKGLFRFWGFSCELIGESYLRGGHPAGQISSTFAIVEYEDGAIHEVEPTYIQFVDNAMSEYAFPEMEE